MSLKPYSYDVFISHSARDKILVRPIAERLRTDGFKLWFDEWVIKPGDSIPSMIDNGIEQSRILLLCLSVYAFGSDWVGLESGSILFPDPLNKKRRLIPLRLDDTPIKTSLAHFAYIDWWDNADGHAYEKLLKACRNYEDWLETGIVSEPELKLLEPQKIVKSRQDRNPGWKQHAHNSKLWLYCRRTGEQ